MRLDSGNDNDVYILSPPGMGFLQDHLPQAQPYMVKQGDSRMGVNTVWKIFKKNEWDFGIIGGLLNSTHYKVLKTPPILVY